MPTLQASGEDQAAKGDTEVTFDDYIATQSGVLAAAALFQKLHGYEAGATGAFGTSHEADKLGLYRPAQKLVPSFSDRPVSVESNNKNGVQELAILVGKRLSADGKVIEPPTKRLQPSLESTPTGTSVRSYFGMTQQPAYSNKHVRDALHRAEVSSAESGSGLSTSAVEMPAVTKQQFYKTAKSQLDQEELYVKQQKTAKLRTQLEQANNTILETQRVYAAYGSKPTGVQAQMFESSKHLRDELDRQYKEALAQVEYDPDILDIKAAKLDLDTKLQHILPDAQLELEGKLSMEKQKQQIKILQETGEAQFTVEHAPAREAIDRQLDDNQQKLFAAYNNGEWYKSAGEVLNSPAMENPAFKQKATEAVLFVEKYTGKDTAITTNLAVPDAEYAALTRLYTSQFSGKDEEFAKNLATTFEKLNKKSLLLDITTFKGQQQTLEEIEEATTLLAKEQEIDSKSPMAQAKIEALVARRTALLRQHMALKTNEVMANSLQVALRDPNTLTAVQNSILMQARQAGVAAVPEHLAMLKTIASSSYTDYLDLGNQLIATLQKERALRGMPQLSGAREADIATDFIKQVGGQINGLYSKALSATGHNLNSEVDMVKNSLAAKSFFEFLGLATRGFEKKTTPTLERLKRQIAEPTPAAPAAPAAQGDKVNLSQVLEDNNGLDFVQRILSPTESPMLKDAKGNFSTHAMAWENMPEGEGAISYPTIVRGKDGKLQRLSPEEAYNYALSTGEFIQFNTPEEAEWFSKNYKQAWK